MNKYAGKYALFVANSFLVILMLISRKPIQRKRIGKLRFFRYSLAVTKGLKKVTNFFKLAFFQYITVKFNKFSTKHVCTEKKEQFQGLMLKLYSKDYFSRYQFFCQCPT